jgi:glutaconate CoA-transferase subunit B
MVKVEYTRQEMMAIATGREIHDYDLCIFGVGLSMLGGFFALKTHAKHAKAMTEGGIYGSTAVGGLPWGIEDNRLLTDGTCYTTGFDALGMLVASGRVDVGVIGAAQIDKYGNVNTSVVGDYYHPKARLAGSGGANDIISGCKRTIINASHEKRRFMEKVDYLTSPAYMGGSNERDKWPFRGKGPSVVVTTLGVLRPDPETKEFYLDAYYPFTSVEEIKQNTGWELKIKPDIEPVPEPTEEELSNLRSVDTTGMLRGQK